MDVGLVGGAGLDAGFGVALEEAGYAVGIVWMEFLGEDGIDEF